VVGSDVEDGGTAAVRLSARTLSELERDVLAALMRLAEDLELDQLRVPARERIHLVANPAWLVERAVDLEPLLGLERGTLRLGAPLPVSLQAQFDALARELSALAWREDEIDLDGGEARPDRGNVVAFAGKAVHRRGVNGCGIELEPVLALRQRRSGKRERGEQGANQ
jgi:hypothetical protein